MPWLSRDQYERLLKRNDDRDFAAMLTTLERVLSEQRSLRTYCQRRFAALEGMQDDDEEPEPTQAPAGFTPMTGWHN